MTNEQLIEEILYKAHEKGFYKKLMKNINSIEFNPKDSIEKCNIYYEVYQKLNKKYNKK
jgi:hypothetical protein